jgi:hypothetical protein
MMVTRHYIDDENFPPLGKIANREQVILWGAEPEEHPVTTQN